jgi:hypothetical protein
VTRVTIQLSDQDVKMLKERTGQTNAEAALRVWITHANPKRSSAQLRASLRESMKEEARGKGRSFRSGREAIRWLES